MHLSQNTQMADDWAIGALDVFSTSLPSPTPGFSSSSSSPLSTFSAYATNTTTHTANNSRLLGNNRSNYDAFDSADNTPRGSWLPHLDHRILLSLSECPCNDDTENNGMLSRPGSVTPRCLPKFNDLSLSDIEALEELPGSSGRRQSTSYRFGHNQVIKVSPHRSILYEARVLAYMTQTDTKIPVPQVFGVRQLHDAGGRVRFCMLMEYIDGIGADEAAYEWGSEETRAFMGSIQSIRQTLATTKSSCIQAIAMLEDIGGNKNSDGDCEMSDGGYNADREEGRLATSDSIHDTFVQDELFDHIWQEMERGPFESEADFVKSVSVALQRRGTSAPRLDLVHLMVNQLRKACSTNESFPLQHANLTLGNFLVRRSSQPGGGGTPEIVGVLGWGQAGFYPAWWDLAKLAASEDRLLVEIAMRDETFPRYSQHASVMLHVRDIIY